MIDNQVLGCIPLRAGCVLIGICSIFLQAIPFLIIYIFLFSAPKNLTSIVFLTLGVTCWSVLLIASIDLFIGVKTRRENFLIPWLVVEPVAWLLMPVPLFYLSKYITMVYFSGPFDFVYFIAAVFLPLSWLFLIFFINVFIYFYGCILTLYKILKAEAVRTNNPQNVSRA